MTADNTRCGYIAIVGRPNVGKSTLFNRLIETYLSPVTHKRQTTRFNIKGILTEAACQMIFVDTPGLDRLATASFNRILNQNAEQALHNVDVIVMVAERECWSKEDETLLDKVKASGKPCVLALNKCDRVRQKERLLPQIDRIQAMHNFVGIFPMSALKDHSFDKLKQTLMDLLPMREYEFEADQISDRSESFLSVELIREQIMNELHQEIPYTIHVAVEKFTDLSTHIHIGALIFVQKENHRPIVIGAKGEKLKRIGSLARRKIEALIDRKVFLELQVKVKASWQSDMEIIKGYLN